MSVVWRLVKLSPAARAPLPPDGEPLRPRDRDGALPLLPLREKVSAQLTDEGSRQPCRFGGRAIGHSGARSKTPHPTGSAGHLLPQGEKGVSIQSPSTEGVRDFNLTVDWPP